MLIYLAALQGVPESLHEAAMIDGAGVWSRFLHVTVPMITPAIFFNLVLGIIDSFQVFTDAFIITNGGPGYSTLVYTLYLYRTAFNNLHMGYASALAWVLFMILLAFTAIQLALSRLGLLRGGGSPKGQRPLAPSPRTSHQDHSTIEESNAHGQPSHRSGRPPHRWRASRQAAPPVSLIVTYVLVVALAIVYAFLFYWMVVLSLKNVTEIDNIPPTLWPTMPTPQNYVDALLQPNRFSALLLEHGRHGQSGRHGPHLSNTVVAYGCPHPFPRAQRPVRAGALDYDDPRLGAAHPPVPPL